MKQYDLLSRVFEAVSLCFSMGVSLSRDNTVEAADLVMTSLSAFVCSLFFSYGVDNEGLLSVGGWCSGVLCQHPSGSSRLLLPLLPAWVRSMSCDHQLNQSPLRSKTPLKGVQPCILHS